VVFLLRILYILRGIPKELNGTNATLNPAAETQLLVRCRRMNTECTAMGECADSALEKRKVIYTSCS
jgi:hypothetical protein